MGDSLEELLIGNPQTIRCTTGKQGTKRERNMDECSDKVAHNIAYYGEDVHTKQTIIEAVARLPRELQEFALDRCCFASVGRGTLAQVLPGRVGLHPVEKNASNMWIIILTEGFRPDEDSRGMIAHEIAHAWLGHDRLGEPPPDCEAQAADLAKQWGFTGKATDATYCTQMSQRAKEGNL